MNRALPPSTPAFPDFVVPHVEERSVGGGIPLAVFRDTTHPLVTLDITFHGGEWYSPQPGLSALTAKMLTRGTKQHSGQALAAQTDYYGATVGMAADRDLLHVHVATLASHFPKVLGVVAEMLMEPNFPKDALETVKTITHNAVLQEEADPSIVAKKLLQQQVFGATHPYGYLTDVPAIARITREGVQHHYAQHKWRNCQMVVTGAINDPILTALQTTFALVAQPPTVARTPLPATKPKACTTTVPWPDSAQASIAIGHPTITLTHPDYPKLYLTNIFLGGYFGSRLMRNIREEKGYTYGIRSRLVPLLHDGYWYVTTEVQQGLAQTVCEEIEKEVMLLQTQEVTEEELQRFKNYLTGYLLSSFDGTFSIAKQFRSVAKHGLGLDYYELLHTTLDHLDAATIRATAQKYFKLGEAQRVVVD